MRNQRRLNELEKNIKSLGRSEKGYVILEDEVILDDDSVISREEFDQLLNSGMIDQSATILEVRFEHEHLPDETET